MSVTNRLLSSISLYKYTVKSRFKRVSQQTHQWTFRPNSDPGAMEKLLIMMGIIVE